MTQESEPTIGTEAHSVLKPIRYQNDEVVQYLAEEEGISPEAAEELFQELLVFLQEVAATGVRKSPLTRLDPAWHAFILHTEAYTEFCQQNFGRYLHHRPRLLGPNYDEGFEDCA